MKGESGFASLSARERQFLTLLAQGHSIKTAAAETGDSEFAANEVLRSARRKLQIGSSREAARLYAAHTQENRHESSGIGSSGSTLKSTLVLTSGAIAMIFLVALSLALASAPSKPRADHAPVPRAVRFSPTNGSTIPPGAFTLSVTFDQPMRRDSFSFATGPENMPPPCDGRVEASSDGRTFTMKCRAEAGQIYVIWANYGAYMNFRSLRGQPAAPRKLTFSVAR